jgi:hypothetical protein
MNSGEQARDARIKALDDVALLGQLSADAADAELNDVECGMVADMYAQAREGRRLTKKQRGWAEDIARRVFPILASDVPKGNRVETPVLLRRANLPMKPPGRV